jgi:hypothetical protein
MAGDVWCCTCTVANTLFPQKGNIFEKVERKKNCMQEHSKVAENDRRFLWVAQTLDIKYVIFVCYQVPDECR